MEYVNEASYQAQAYYYHYYNNYVYYQQRVYEDPWFWLFIVFALTTVVVLTLFLLQKYRYYTKPYVKKRPCEGKKKGRKEDKHPRVTHFDAADPTRHHGHHGHDDDSSSESDVVDRYLCHKVFILNGEEVQLGAPIYVVTWAADGEKCQCLHVENCHGEVQTYTSEIKPHDCPTPCTLSFTKKSQGSKKFQDSKKECRWCATAHPAKVKKRRQCTVWEIPTIGNFWASTVYVRLCLETECLTTEWYSVYIFKCTPHQPSIISAQLWCNYSDHHHHTTGEAGDVHHHSSHSHQRHIHQLSASASDFFGFEENTLASNIINIGREVGTGNNQLETRRPAGAVRHHQSGRHNPYRPESLHEMWEGEKTVWARAVVYDALRMPSLEVKFELVCISCDDDKHFEVKECQVFEDAAPSCPAHLFAHWEVDVEAYDWCFLKVSLPLSPSSSAYAKSVFCALMPIYMLADGAKSCHRCDRKCHYILGLN